MSLPLNFWLLGKVSIILPKTAGYDISTWDRYDIIILE